MTLTLLLNEEQIDAITRRKDAYNADAGVDMDNEDFLTRSAMAQVNDWVAADRDAAVKRLGAMASGAPYDKRKALIAYVESQLGGA